MNKVRIWSLTVCMTFLVGCEAVGPALVQLAIKFGQDLIATAAVNHTPRYAIEVESLLVALANQVTNLQMQPALAQSGYQSPQQVSGQSATTNDGVYPQVAYAEEAYETAGANEGGSSGYPASGQVRGIGPVELDVALLTQRAGTIGLETVEDGVTLRDGGADPSSGDLLKAYFRTNCRCYVYVVGVDATGYVAQIFPDNDANAANPVEAGQEYLLPAEDDGWWALDAYKGLEQVFFVASHQQRLDIEEVLTRLGNLPRSAQPQSYEPVSEPALIPATRGLVRIKKEPVQVALTDGTFPINPELFQARDETNGVVVTRWFYHE